MMPYVYMGFFFPQVEIQSQRVETSKYEMKCTRMHYVTISLQCTILYYYIILSIFIVFDLSGCGTLAWHQQR